jgi:glycosyltransferase involved in cell wall biosynthesis
MSPAAGDARVPPLLSVVIPTRNREESLRRTVRCLQEQTLEPEAYEVLVVDDGSDQPVSQTAVDVGPNTRVVRLAHVERSAARNRGGRDAKGQILLFVDDDMLASRNLLEAHAAAHVQWPRALVVGAIRLPDEALATPFGRFRQALEASSVPLARGPVAQPNFATAANMSISRERFLALGGFDTAFVSSEDQDLALRHSAAGGPIVYLPEAVATHDDSATDLRAYCRRSEWGAQKMAPFCRRYPDWPENRERRDVNGPICWDEDPPGRILRKVGKALLGLRLPLAVFFALIERLETRAPSSRILASLYRLALGIHLQRGFRSGWSSERLQLATENTER